MSSARGVLITFEGIDGSGKTTVSRAVVAMLKNQFGPYEVKWSFEPNHPSYQAMLAHARSDEERLFLFLADRAKHYQSISASVLEGKIVVLDRYIDSTYAYIPRRLHRLFEDRGIDPYELIGISCSYLFPDATILLKVDPSVAYQRITQRDMLAEDYDMELLRSAHEYYTRLESMFPNRIIAIDTTHLSTDHVITMCAEIAARIVINKRGNTNDASGSHLEGT